MYITVSATKCIILGARVINGFNCGKSGRTFDLIRQKVPGVYFTLIFLYKNYIIQMFLFACGGDGA